MKHAHFSFDTLESAPLHTRGLPGQRNGFPKGALVALLLLVAAFIIRMPWLGDMTYHEDESFYLVVAKAMHQGAMPYIDIWDRKPLGLFLIYWAATLPPIDGFLAYHLVSSVFAGATAWTIYAIARRVHGDLAGICAGLVYLVCTPALLGAGGQSPIFYNLFVATGALLMTTLFAGPASLRAIWWRGGLAMFACGLALTVKQTSIVESLFMGLAASYLAFFRSGAPMPWRVSAIAWFAVLGALPTLSILGYFLSIGELDTYWHATVISNNLKPSQPFMISMGSALLLGILLVPFWLICAVGLYQANRATPQTIVKRFLLGWTIAAVGGFLLVPNFWNHYALPLLPPLTVQAAAVFARPRTGLLWGAVIASWTMFVTNWPSTNRADKSNAQLTRIAETIEREREGGCVYVYEGAPAIYAVTNGCRVTTRIFPQHLDFEREAPAVGVNPSQEMRRILARRPAIIITTSIPLALPRNLRTRAILHDGLRASYRQIAAMPLSESNKPDYKVLIWQRIGMGAKTAR